MRKIDVTPIVVDPFNTDFQQRWNWTTLGKALLNAAENHAKARGFGMMELNGNHYTWVLARLTIEMVNMPMVYTKLNVSTWIESIYSLFTNRNFSITAADGTVYGYARSVWAMIDYDTRQPAQLEQMEGQAFEPYLFPEQPCPIEKAGRVRPLNDDDYICSLDTRYSDIDMNSHVNSIKYVEHMMDLFPMEAYQNGRNLRRLEIAYMAESYYGDRLSLFRRQVDEDTFEVEIRKDYEGPDAKGKTCVRALLKFG